MMVKRKLDGAVDKFLKNSKSNTTVQKMPKILRPVPSGSQSYGRLADKIWVRLKIFKSLLQIEFDFPLCLVKLQHCFNNIDALQTFFSGKNCYKVV